MKSTLLGAWRGALACFVVAALTGALYRLQAGLGIDVGLSIENVRHAHSHLMFFGWATPALMALLLGALADPRGAVPPRQLRVLFGVLFATALVTWPLFLAFGYRTVAIGAAELPPAAVASGVAMLPWYAFALVYRRATGGRPRTRAVWIWDLAVIFLVASTAGAWGLSFAGPLGMGDPRILGGLKHLFLDLFSEGWFMLGVLGLAWHRLAPDERGVDLGLVLVACGLPLGFLLAMPAASVPPVLRAAAAIAGVGSSLGLLHQVVVLWPRAAGPRAWVWRVPLGLLALAALGRLVASMVPSVDWASLAGVRLLYLHLLLLGFVTLGLWSAAEQTFGIRQAGTPLALHLAALLVIGSLVFLSIAWPTEWSGRWTGDFAAAAALLPAVVTLLATRWTSTSPIARASRGPTCSSV
jgi:hypothetical protein